MSDNPCVRGCIAAGRHDNACAPDVHNCTGCAPAPTHEPWSTLCYRCHRNLSYALRHAPGQHDLLLAMAEPGTDTTALDDAGRRRGTSDDLPAAVNVARLAAAQDIADALSQWVEWVVEEHRMLGPKRLLTQYQRDVHGQRKRHWSNALGAYIWVDPPSRFAVGSACRWLASQIEHLESSPWIGDELGPFLDLMSMAHGLAPWRAASGGIKDVPCPNCQAATLRKFDGEDDVRCTTCRSMFSHDRYLMWVRILETEATA